MSTCGHVHVCVTRTEYKSSHNPYMPHCSPECSCSCSRMPPHLACRCLSSRQLQARHPMSPTSPPRGAHGRQAASGLSSPAQLASPPPRDIPTWASGTKLNQAARPLCSSQLPLVSLPASPCLQVPLLTGDPRFPLCLLPPLLYLAAQAPGLSETRRWPCSRSRALRSSVFRPKNISCHPVLGSQPRVRAGAPPPADHAASASKSILGSLGVSGCSAASRAAGCESEAQG